MEFGPLLLSLAIILVGAKLAGEAAERVGQTAVLGELLLGIVLGQSVLGFVPESEVLHFLAEIGVILLLFEIGLESDLQDLLRAGPQATLVAFVGVLCPFGLGYLVATAWGLGPLVGVFVGATMTATSVGITARVLADLGKLDEAGAKIILGAAVVDDVIGLIILALVSGLAKTGAVSFGVVTTALIKAVGFLLAALVVGLRVTPYLFRWILQMRVRGTLIVAAVSFCLLLAYVGAVLGLATIVGAFAAGLVLTRIESRAHIAESLKPVADLFVPVFFITVGSQVDVGVFNPLATGAGRTLLLTGLFTLVAVVSKLLSGLAIYQRKVRRLPVGVGMIPRGEVGLIFLRMGLTTGLIEQDLYGSLVAMVVISTFIVPIWLKAVYRVGG